MEGREKLRRALRRSVTWMEAEEFRLTTDADGWVSKEIRGSQFGLSLREEGLVLYEGEFGKERWFVKAWAIRVGYEIRGVRSTRFPSFRVIDLNGAAVWLDMELGRDEDDTRISNLEYCLHMEHGYRRIDLIRLVGYLKMRELLINTEAKVEPRFVGKWKDCVRVSKEAILAIGGEKAGDFRKIRV